MNTAKKPLVTQSDRLPPQNTDAEQLLVGSILLNPIGLEQIFSIVAPEFFYNPSYGSIYHAAIELFRSMRPIDIVTVSTWLGEQKLLAKVGGKEALSNLQDCTPYGLDIEGYAKEVRRYYIHRQMIATGQHLVELGYDTSRDLREMLQDSEQSVFSVSQGYQEGRGWRSPADGIDAIVEQVIERRISGEPVGIASGLYDLDAKTRGFKKNNAIYIIGRPGMAKTSLALQMAKHVAESLKLVAAVFSLEMSYDEMMLRLISGETGIESGRIEAGELSDEEILAVAQSATRIKAIGELRINDTPGLTIEEIASECRKLQSDTGKLGIVFIDHLHMLNYGSQDEIRAITHITKTVKNLAKELGVPVVMLAQLNRGVEGRTDKRPLMSDIRASGSAEQDADIVIGLYRDEYYNPETVDRGVAELILLKHRGGPVGTVKVLFEPQYTRFKNLASSKGAEMHKPPTPPEPQYTYDPPTEQRDRAVANAFYDPQDYGDEF